MAAPRVDSGELVWFLTADELLRVQLLVGTLTRVEQTVVHLRLQLRFLARDGASLSIF